MSLNYWNGIGRLTADPELRYTAGNGTAVATFTLAIDRDYKNDDGTRDTDFIRIVAWGKLAENVADFLGKGRLVAVHGRLQTRSYENNEGFKVYVSEINAENVQFLDKPREEASSQEDEWSEPSRGSGRSQSKQRNQQRQGNTRQGSRR